MDKLKQLILANRESIIKPTVVLFAICLIIALALASANLVTEPKIAALEKQAQNEAMKTVIKADEYIKSEAELSGDKITFYTAESDGKTVGYIFTFAEKGYGGDVNVMTGIATDGTIIAVDILDASQETPGLGQNVTKEEFYSQYTGKSGGLGVVKNGASENEVDAVTGATISSKAVTNAVNRAVEAYEDLKLDSSDKGGAAE